MSLFSKTIILFFSLLSASCAQIQPVSEQQAMSKQQAGLRILAYGDSNTWGWIPTEAGFPTVRLDDDQRWAGVLEQNLNAESTVIVSGMVGRTANIDLLQAVGNIAPQLFNGSSQLPAVLASQTPLDWLVIMLGTNDLQQGLQVSSQKISQSVFALAEQARNMNQPLYSQYKAPKVLVIAPAALSDTSNTPLSGLFKVAEQPSKQLSSAFKKEASKHPEVFFLDASKIISSDGVDGVHLTINAHKALGKAVANKIKQHTD